MAFAPIIIIRILFAICMVFIIGYIFGGFSEKPSLTIITRIAAVLLIVLFIATNVFFIRFGFRHFYGKGQCGGPFAEKKELPR